MSSRSVEARLASVRERQDRLRKEEKELLRLIRLKERTESQKRLADLGRLVESVTGRIETEEQKQKLVTLLKKYNK